MPDEKNLEKQLSDKDKHIEALKKKIALYESKGPQRLFWALNRKVNEMEEILNSTVLKSVFDDFEIAPKKFDRLRVLYTDAPSFIKEVEALRKELGITGEKEKEEKGRYNFIEQFAESRQ